jgi:O-antigen/teichoic acid export membrane protein
MDVGISGYILINLFSSILLGLNQYRKYSLSYIFVNIFSYFFPIALLLLQRKAIFVIVGITIANIIDAGIFICLVSGVYRKISSTGKSEIIEPYRSLVIYSFPLFFASLMTTGSTYLDRIVVSYFLNLSYLGIYNFALVIASAASVFIMPITNLLIPKLSSYFSLNDRKGFRNSIRTLLNIASLIYIPTAMGIASLSKITLYNFAGKAYVISYIPLIIIMFVTSLCIGAVILASGIKSIRKSRLFIFSSGMSLLSNIILSVLLIPRFNIIGASIAYSSMTAVNFIIIYSYARKMNVANYDKKSILKIWISSLIMFFFIFLIQSYFAYTILNEFIYIITGILLFSIEIRVFRLIGPEELKFIFSVIPEKLVKIRHIVGILSGEA